jgi:fibrillarin-like rRNA methylase
MGAWKIYGLKLSDEVLRKLYHDNAARELGLPMLEAAPEPRTYAEALA